MQKIKRSISPRLKCAARDSTFVEPKLNTRKSRRLIMRNCFRTFYVYIFREIVILNTSGALLGPREKSLRKPHLKVTCNIIVIFAYVNGIFRTRLLIILLCLKEMISNATMIRCCESHFNKNFFFQVVRAVLQVGIVWFFLE